MTLALALPNRKDVIKALLDQGLGKTEIARRIGLTKNTVIGICYRAGWSVMRAPTMRYVPAAADLASPSGCKWPGVGDAPMLDPMRPGFRFCGEPAIEGKPYCPTHARRAHYTVMRDFLPVVWMGGKGSAA